MGDFGGVRSKNANREIGVPGGSAQSVFLALIEEGFPADAQNLRALADFVAGRFERGANSLAFHVIERAQRASVRGVRRADVLRKILGNERGPAGKNERA